MTSCTNAQSTTKTSLRISLDAPVILEAVNNEYTCGLAGKAIKNHKFIM